MKAFIWSGIDVVAAGKCSVAWSQVARPKDLGVLGILDWQRFGQALQLRWDWRARTTDSANLRISSASAHNAVTTFFQHSLRVIIGDGSAARFWTDAWLDGQSVQSIAPYLL